MKNPGCLVCGDDLLLINHAEHYAWNCVHECTPPLDTGVAVSENIEAYKSRGLTKSGGLNFSFAANPVARRYGAGGKVFMPFILYHFIECSWGGCYNSLFNHVIVPDLDAVDVLKYVLRSPVVFESGHSTASLLPPKMYAELYSRLVQVKSPAIREYVVSQFGARYGAGAGGLQ